MNELSADVDAWIKATLKADITLMGDDTHPALITGVFPDIAPAGTKYPLIVFSMHTGMDRNAVDGTPGATHFLYQVKAIGKDGQPYASLQPIVARIYDLLHKQTGTFGQTQIISCLRKSVLKYPDIGEGGARYNHFGAIYSIWAQDKPAS